ncbi:KilA-N domain-containing protein [Alysiella crassa]|uniref:KilA-N domain n=1 Tax=Alysiella crassa TaxID=153491 RepID=A0A376BW29_9NEIS|nr:KilA-N domain-containing protein [Alysiella crassa]UOP06509.1 KilA-N domain-containing protein [Alysiella crassa]SSY81041.1 KilA-N domain [Alysiella crassa]
MQNIVSIQNITIRQTADNLYSLNDLHKASGGEDKHAPRRWLQNQQTDELIAELSKDGNSSLDKNQQVIQVIKGGNNSGTFVCKELVIHYAMWISPKFSLQVIQTFLNTVENSGSLNKPLPPEYFTHLAKMTRYAGKLWQFQNLMCQSPNSEQAKTMLNELVYSTNINETGFLFIFKPNLKADIQQAVDWLHTQSQVI